jgi:hypothetical protein
VLVEQELLAGLMRECCLHYLDDIWVYLRSWPEYIHHLSQVFEPSFRPLHLDRRRTSEPFSAPVDGCESTSRTLRVSCCPGMLCLLRKESRNGRKKRFQSYQAPVPTTLILCRPEHERRFYLQTNAAKAGMGTVLYQLGYEDVQKIISFASTKFSPTEAKYHSDE